MVNVIFNDINYDDTKFRKLKYEEYLTLIKWGRKYPTRFVEKILDIQLTDHQKYIFLSMWNAESICILASRSSGKSFIIAVYIMARSILYPNHDTCIIAPDGKQSKLLFSKIEDIAKHNITSIKNKSNVFYNEIEKSVNTDGFRHDDQFNFRLYNGSSVKTYNNNPEKNVGVRCSLVVYDEAGKIPNSNFTLYDPFLTQDPDSVTGNINQECYPKQMRHQRILLSSAEGTDTELFKTYKMCALKMLAGNRDYFVVDLNCEMSLHPTMNGKPMPGLVSQGDIDRAMALNEIRAMREYYNIFDGNNSEDSVVRRSAIDRNSVPYAPIFYNPDGKTMFTLAYDPAEKNDNSFVLSAMYFRDPERGWMMKLANGVNFLEVLPNGTKKILTKPEQVESFKQLMLDYNGYRHGARDYENLSLLIDPGSGGGGYSVSTYLLDNWYGKDGVKHFGIIDKSDKNLSLEAYKFPEAKDILKLPSANSMKLEMFAAATDMIEQDLVTFPKPLNLRQEIEYEDYDEEGNISLRCVKASREEIRALTEIDLACTEICSLQRIKNVNGNIQIRLPNNLENKKIHDDRAYCLAMLCWKLSELRKGEMLNKQHGDNSWQKKYKGSQSMDKRKNNNPFNNKDTNPFANMGKNPFR